MNTTGYSLLDFEASCAGCGAAMTMKVVEGTVSKNIQVLCGPCSNDLRWESSLAPGEKSKYVTYQRFASDALMRPIA